MEARWDKRADGINTSIQHSTQLLQGLHFLKIQIKFADKEKKIPFLWQSYFSIILGRTK